MFDRFIVDLDRLPSFVGDPMGGFQTKDFDSSMTTVRITRDGRLEIEDFEYEVVPPEERPHPNSEGIRGLAGSLRRINCRWREIGGDLVVNFYNMDTDYFAEFVGGRLMGIRDGTGGYKATRWGKVRKLVGPQTS